MTKGRVYVLINNNNKPYQIYYFNKDLKTNKRIDLLQYHNKKIPHVHNFEDLEYRNSKDGTSKIDKFEDKKVKSVEKIYNNNYNMFVV